jgi:hypothetical protein
MRLSPLFVLIALVVNVVHVNVPYAHPGRTAADGCHYCRTNCAQWGVPYGERHCHGGNPRSSATPVPQAQTEIPKKSGGILRLDYEGFTIWLDCKRRGAIKFRYNAQRDQLIVPDCSISPKFLKLLKRGHENASRGSRPTPPLALICA